MLPSYSTSDCKWLNVYGVVEDTLSQVEEDKKQKVIDEIEEILERYRKN